MKKTGSILFASLLICLFPYFLSGAEAMLLAENTAPDFLLSDIEGGQVRLSRIMQDNTVIMFFWSTWSMNSESALSSFEEYYEYYKDRGIQVIGVNADNQSISGDDVTEIRRVVKKLNISFPILLDQGLETFRDYDIIALPSTVVITRSIISYALPGWPLQGTEDMFDYLYSLPR